MFLGNSFDVIWFLIVEPAGVEVNQSQSGPQSVGERCTTVMNHSLARVAATETYRRRRKQESSSITDNDLRRILKLQ